MKSPRRRTSRLIALALPALLPAGLARAQAVPAVPTTTPSTSPAAGGDVGVAADPRQIAQLIARLGSDDFDTREAAAKQLWGLGDRAIPALRAAAEGDDPEVAQRAQVVLESFAYGIRPDTPKVVSDLLNKFRAGNDDQKQEAAAELGQLGVSGGRVLLKLVREAQGEDVGRTIRQSLANNAREIATGLLAGGDLTQAADLLKLAAPENETAARDWAAFLLLHGGADDEIGRLQGLVADAKKAAAAPAPPQPVPESEDAAPPAVRLAYLHRAKGDLKNARQALEGVDDPFLLDALLADAGDWKALAAAATARGAGKAVDEMGPMIAYHRLAGDAAGADGWAAKLVEASPGLDRVWDAAEALLLNGRPAQATDVLMRNKDYARAAEFFAPRLDVDGAKALLDTAQKEGASDLAGVQIQVAQALDLTGDEAAVTGLLKSAALGSRGNARAVGAMGEFLARVELVGVGRLTRQSPALIDAWLVDGIAAARSPRMAAEQVDRGLLPRLRYLYAKAGFEHPELAAQWWPAMRDNHGGESPADTMAKLRDLDRKQWSAGDVAKLATEARTAADALPPAERIARLQLIGDTQDVYGQTDEAIKTYESLAQKSEDGELLSRLGDLYATAKRWDESAAAYGRSLAKRPGDVATTALRGVSLLRAGKEQAGRELLALAHLLPLGDEAARDALADALDKRDMKAEAIAERELIVRVGEPGALKTADALRSLAQAAAERGEHLAAADLWERAFLANLSPEISFNDISSNLLIPVMVHRTRAIGLAHAGRLAEAVREADQCFALSAGDTDSQIEIIRALDEKGARAEADALYARAFGFYDKLRLQYPNSASALNLVAWLQGSVKRDLDPALAHAKRAVEIEPTNAAILDTLTEVYFARKEYDKALELNASIIKMEPNVPHHQKNKERFTAAKEGRPTAKPAAGE